MDHYFRYDAIRQRLRVGPLSGYLDTFAQKLSEYGYAIDTGQQQLRTVSRLSQWMGRRGLQAHDLSEQVLKRFLADRRRQGRLRHTDPKALGWFLEHLRQTGVVEPTLPCFADDVQGPLERDFERLSPPRAWAGRGDDRQLLVGLAHVPHDALQQGDGRSAPAAPRRCHPLRSVESPSRNRPARPSSPSPAFGPSCAFCTCKAGRPPISPPRSRRYPTGR